MPKTFASVNDWWRYSQAQDEEARRAKEEAEALAAPRADTDAVPSNESDPTSAYDLADRIWGDSGPFMPVPSPAPATVPRPISSPWNGQLGAVPFTQGAGPWMAPAGVAPTDALESGLPGSPFGLTLALGGAPTALMAGWPYGGPRALSSQPAQWPNPTTSTSLPNQQQSPVGYASKNGTDWQRGYNSASSTDDATGAWAPNGAPAFVNGPDTANLVEKVQQPSDLPPPGNIEQICKLDPAQEAARIFNQFLPRVGTIDPFTGRVITLEWIREQARQMEQMTRQSQQELRCAPI
jgi:hypothetical protein